MNRILLIVFLLCGTLFAQVFSNLDTSATTGWTICSACAGGLNNGTGDLTEITTGTPNGHGLQAHVNGPGWANVLFWKTLDPTHAVINANYFYYDIQEFVTTTWMQGIQVLEYDNFIYSPTHRWMFGSQCVINGTWWGWNDLTKSWVDIHIPCTLTAGKTHHIQWWNHRDPDTSVACGGMPCTYQDTLAVDDVFYSVNLVTPASMLPPNWQPDMGAQFQIGQNALPGDVYEDVANLTLTAFGQ